MKTLLVIGNGFDLKLGAKTRYKEFFESPFYSDTKRKIEAWVTQCRQYITHGLEPTINMTETGFSCWDLLIQDND